MAEDTRAELASLREEVRELKDKVAAMEGIIQLLGANRAAQGANGGTFRWVEHDGRKYEVRDGEDPDEIFRSWMGIMARIDTDPPGPPGSS